MVHISSEWFQTFWSNSVFLILTIRRSFERATNKFLMINSWTLRSNLSPEQFPTLVRATIREPRSYSLPIKPQDRLAKKNGKPLLERLSRDLRMSKNFILMVTVSTRNTSIDLDIQQYSNSQTTPSYSATVGKGSSPRKDPRRPVSIYCLECRLSKNTRLTQIAKRTQRLYRGQLPVNG